MPLFLKPFRIAGAMLDWHIVLSGDVANWLLAAGTLLLAGVTGVLALAAWRALGQLKVALEELDEIKRDRHVQVFSDMGSRWGSAEITEALQMEVGHTAESLARLFNRYKRPRSSNPVVEYRRRRAERAAIVLLRIPNYFEEAGMIAKVGTLETATVDEYFGGVAQDEWALWAPTIKRFQESDPEAFVEFERMAKEATKADGDL
jgi:hypothetical protein